MILSEDEMLSLVRLHHRCPHQLLGMHPLGDGSGVVVRAFIPGARSVEAVPTHEKKRPRIQMQRVHEAGLFEGVSHDTKGVYAYDLKVRNGGDQDLQSRDPYSFLPTLGETDLYLFGQGNER